MEGEAVRVSFERLTARSNPNTYPRSLLVCQDHGPSNDTPKA